jgi:putative ABC transport system substrate-binding protein
MNRRDFVGFTVGFVSAVPKVACAQRTRAEVRIGYLGTNRDTPLGAAIYQGFLHQLSLAGFDEKRNLTVVFRPIEQDPAALYSDALALVKSNVDVIVTDGTEAALKAALGASSAVPIVMIATNFDPIARGYVKSLARPGGNVTGVFIQQIELAEKQTELLHQAVPEGVRLAVLWDSLSEGQFAAATRRAKELRFEVYSIKLDNAPYDFDAAFRNLSHSSPQMLLVLSSPNFTQSRSHIAELAIQFRLPTMFIFKTYVEAGGLMSYGVDYVEMHRQAATYAARILTGTKPADLPVQQPIKFEFAVNEKTAKELGLAIPQSILVRADEVFE